MRYQYSRTHKNLAQARVKVKAIAREYAKDLHLLIRTKMECVTTRVNARPIQLGTKEMARAKAMVRDKAVVRD